ncbi:tetratricopeptide repeat protein [Nitrospina gracilis]|uniref:tetratricopeptide repeat protein n=1 Tax=Nitrospina gracilis TaxID=35801 RepID=UPI001F385FB6|nr:tetratricopeptide repeat protein [Nitrospina gracilis]MCF8719571.1 tetratricopeptide (TPR) repeat protein [Nitrospina gracilis Nb-211]
MTGLPPDNPESCDTPSDPAEIHFRKAWQCRRAKKLEEAIAEFEKSLSYEPNHPATHFNLGLVADQIGQGQKAVHHAEKARDLFLLRNDDSKRATAQRLLNKLYRKYPEHDPARR